MDAGELAVDQNLANDIRLMGVRIMTVQVGPLNNIYTLATPGLNTSYTDGTQLLDKGMDDFINNTLCNGNNCLFSNSSVKSNSQS